MRRSVIVITIIVLSLALGIGAAAAYGGWRWQARTRALHADMDAARVSELAAVYDEEEIEDLPAPVRRYFRSVLRSGQPMIAVARFSEEGEFLVHEEPVRWGAFRARHRVAVRPPAFDWDARIAWAPGVKVFVRDAYIGRAGILHAAAFGLVSLVNQRGTPELAEGELMRFLAEAPWYPTALLPRQGVRWQAIDDSTARASLTDGMTTVSLDFSFDSNGLITSVWSPARYRDVNGTPTPTPWQGRFSRYEARSGMRIPTRAEVAWIGAGGAMPYWRGRVTAVEFQLAGERRQAVLR
jgi:hypothetical protein